MSPVTAVAIRQFSSDGHDSDHLTHVDSDGKAAMVGVGHKTITRRTAVASGKIIIGEAAFKLVSDNNIKKGDVLTVAQIAGVMAAKKTSSLIPLCHPLNLDNIKVKGVLIIQVNCTEFCQVQLKLDPEDYSVKVQSEVDVSAKTGVEMEALTSVSVTLLTVYDMCKAVTKNMTITDIKLDIKTGGKSDYSASKS